MSLDKFHERAMQSYAGDFTTPPPATRALRGGNTWRSSHGHTVLAIEPTYPGDTMATAWVGDPSDGPGVALSPQQLREVAADLIARADLIDGGA